MSMLFSLTELAREPRLASCFLSFLNNMVPLAWLEMVGCLPLSWLEEVGGFPPYILFLFWFFLFFFLSTWLLVVVLSLDEEEGRGEYFTGEECKGLTLVGCPWSKVISWEALGAFEETIVENNQTSSPIVNSGRFRVAIMGGPTFPKHVKSQGSPWIGVPWLVLSRISTINSKLNLEAC